MAIIITDQATTIKFDLGNGEEHHLDKASLSIKKKFGSVFVYGSADTDGHYTKLRLKYTDVSVPVTISNTDLINTLLGYKSSVGAVVGDVRITDGVEVLDIKANSHTLNSEALVNLEGHVCDNNSSKALLGIGGVFAGSWEDNIDFGTIIIGIKADQDSATDGLTIQWSSDGVTVHDDDHYTILANNGKTFTFQPVRRYFRIQYTNGGVAQGFFDLETTMRRYYIKPSSHRIQDKIVTEDDAELMKSVITGQRADGIFDNVGIDNDNNLKVNSFPYTYAIAEGDVDGHSAVLKFGTRTLVAANTPSVVWQGTNPLYTYLPTAQQLKISSTSAQDGVGGTGIRTLFLSGLDANYNEISETITMTGLAVVTTALSYLRIFRAYGVTSGTSHTNVGIITVTDNAGTVQQLVIPIGDGQTLMAMWTVPAGKKAYMVAGSISTDSNKGLEVSFFVRINNGGLLYPWLIKYRAFIFSGNENFPFQIPFPISEKTDIEVRVKTPGSAGTTQAGGTFELWYEDM
jgi:hypothetical protein